MVVLADRALGPDFSWVPDSLRGLSGAWLAACMTVAVVAAVAGAIRWAFSRATAAQWDNVQGSVVLACVTVGALVLGILPSLAQTGIDHWSGQPTTQVEQYTGAQKKPDDEGKDTLTKIADSAKDAAKKAGDKLQEMIDGFKSAIDKLSSAVEALKPSNWLDKLAGLIKGDGSSTSSAAPPAPSKPTYGGM